jgi:hypothetical protein
LQAYSRDATVVGRRADYEAVAFSDCLHKILLLGRTFWQFGCKMRERLKVHTGEKPRTGAEPFKLRQDSAADALAGGGLSSRTPEPHNHRLHVFRPVCVLGQLVSPRFLGAEGAAMPLLAFPQPFFLAQFM